MNARYVPHHHDDDLGSPRRAGEIAICGGCGRVVKVAVAYGTGWWRPMLWPWSTRWRRRLSAAGTDPGEGM